MQLSVGIVSQKQLDIPAQDGVDPASSDNSTSESPLEDLRFVNLDGIVAQEGLDIRRADQLINNIKAAGYLRHPVYLSPLGPYKFTSFDGHNRINALRKLGYDTILAQIIPLKNISAGTWMHIVEASLEKCLARLTERGLSCAPTSKRTGLLNEEGVVAVVQSDSDQFLISNQTRASRVGVTSIVVDALIEATDKKIERRPDTALYDHINSTNGKIRVRFPTLTPQQVIEAVLKGEQVGAGVTRWEFHGRVVNANLPLGPWLNESLDLLNTELRKIIRSGTARAYCNHVTEMEVTWPWY